jgi:hypothetical protein
MSERLSDFHSSANLGIYNDHPHKMPDSEDVAQPVLVRVVVSGFRPLAYDDKEAKATHNYAVRYQWEDPRLAGWSEDAEFPADLWVPPLAVWGRSSDGDREKMKGNWKSQGSLGVPHKPQTHA